MSAKKQLSSPLSAAERGRLEEMKPADRFGKSGYAMVPHAYFTVLMRKVSGLAQYHAIGYIMDRTFGAIGNPTWAKLSGTQMARLSGMTAKAYTLVLDDAVRRGLIECKEDGRGFMYRAWPEAWAAIPDYELTAAPEEEPAEEPEQAPAVEAPAPPTDSRETLVANGKRSTIAFKLSFADEAPPVDLKLRTRNDTGLALRFLTSISRSGEIDLTVFSGETKANSIGSPLPIELTASEKNQRFTAFAAFINAQCLKHFPKVPDPALMKRIVAAAGDASLDEFAKVVVARVAKLGRNHRYDATLLENLAQDAARNAKASQLIEQETLRRNPPEPAIDRAEFLRGERERFQANPDFAELIREQNPDFFAEVMGATTAE